MHSWVIAIEEEDSLTLLNIAKDLGTIRLALSWGSSLAIVDIRESLDKEVVTYEDDVRKRRSFELLPCTGYVGLKIRHSLIPSLYMRCSKPVRKLNDRVNVHSTTGVKLKELRFLVAKSELEI